MQENQETNNTEVASHKHVSVDEYLLGDVITPPTVGGQAILEGVMMRAPGLLGIAVRKPDGKIIVKKDEIKVDNNPIFKKPFIRGLIGLYDATVVGYRALEFSASFVEEDDNSKDKKNKDNASTESSNNDSGKKKTVVISALEKYVAIIVSIVFGVGLFLALPLLVTNLCAKFFPIIDEEPILYNLIDGLVRVVVFVLYIFIIGLSDDIKRVFMYHGAEHKAIFTYEKGEPLTLDNVRNNSRFHPRCGTSFLFIVLIISIFVFSLIPQSAPIYIKILGRVVFIPVIAGISYELLKLSFKLERNFIVRILIAPGLMLQRLTTREPTDDMLEVAIASIYVATNNSDITASIKEQIEVYLPENYVHDDSSNNNSNTSSANSVA